MAPLFADVGSLAPKSRASQRIRDRPGKIYIPDPTRYRDARPGIRHLQTPQNDAIRRAEWADGRGVFKPQGNLPRGEYGR